ncbi:MAG: Gfo/Idh/MocA family protein [Thermomicrobiales bacterium]
MSEAKAGEGQAGRQTVRVAMIGAGKMANRVHYPSLASFDDVAMVAVCDLDSARLTATADTYQIEGRYSNFQQMIEQTAPDAVYAIGPPHQMYDPWVWCLERGLNLFIEKPMGITFHQAQTLAYLARERGCITQVGFQRRSSPLAVQLRDECLARGPIVHAVCRFYKHEIAPFSSALGHMMDDGVHAIDTLRWMCGGDVVDVQSMTKRVLVPDINFIAATLHFDNGATGLLLNSWSSGRRIFAVEMHAPGICAEADLEGQGRLFADGDTAGVSFDACVAAGGREFFVYGGFQAKNREFIDGVQMGRQPSSNFSDALKTMEIAETILARAVLA